MRLYKRTGQAQEKQLRVWKKFSESVSAAIDIDAEEPMPNT
ncbi:predicted protein [Sclerotinia sclerotiorum 1980 UF-70]|uniref:Uncharacterized protein n=1 Tax=Sclerotinia sclerotiorum (strain ATCC 18683 / 1980 / Ss-1) TaxID=665079 RepID=A7EYG4_SCLS1|nr:predicted protein [Sclerotinia sclerotiorum 1980 UF-70]EDN94506.1 predicted protein [Sclerotinia sclerotiorum 1980 UF-70]